MSSCFVERTWPKNKEPSQLAIKCCRMAPSIELEADHIKDKARKDLLSLLEGVSEARMETQKKFC